MFRSLFSSVCIPQQWQLVCINFKAHLSLHFAESTHFTRAIPCSRDMLRALRVALGDPGHRLLKLQSEEDLYHDRRRVPISMSNVKMLSS